eukprot:EG_transcript_4497
MAGPCLLLPLLLLVFGLGPSPSAAESPCDEVPWRPRKSVLLVTSDLQRTFPQRAMLQAAALLVAADLEVEVAALAAGPLLEAYQRLNVTVHLVNPADRSPCGMMQELQRLHEDRLFIGMVWGITHFFDVYRCIWPLPGTFSVLWVLEDHWPKEGLPADVVDMDWTNALRFDYMAFWNSETMVRYASLVNPTGHLPISFAVLNHSTGVHPAAEVPMQWMTNALLRRLGDAAPHHKGQLMADIGEDFRLNPANLAAAPELPETCPHNWFAQLVVVVHLGRHKAERLDSLAPALKDQAHNVHFWVTYTHIHNRRGVLNLLNRTRMVFHPLMVRDHGLDIGPFFTLLWQFARCHYRYTFLLKAHFKSEEAHSLSRQAALFWKQPNFLSTAIQHMKRNINISAVYGRIPGITDPRVIRTLNVFYGDNLEYIQDIVARVPVPIAQDSFLSGSVWLTRASTLTRWLHSAAQIWAIYSELNDPMGLDWRWYSRRILRANCNRSAVQLHYYVKGWRENKPPNCYAPIPGYFEPKRDGMIEHAWERVFSYMFSYHGPFEALEASKAVIA